MSLLPALLCIVPIVRTVLVRRYLSLRVTRDELSDGMRRLPGLLRYGLRVVPAQLVSGFSDQISYGTPITNSA